MCTDVNICVLGSATLITTGWGISIHFLTATAVEKKVSSRSITGV